MAPECITNLPYDQRADVFSFGVILLEVIGRVSADPDVLLRTPTFGVDYVAFASLCPPDCDLELLLLAFTCCLVSPHVGVGVLCWCSRLGRRRRFWGSTRGCCFMVVDILYGVVFKWRSYVQIS